MKTTLDRILCAFVGAVFGVVVLGALAVFYGRTIAAEDDLLLQQRNSTDTATLIRIPPHPSTWGVLAYDGAGSLLPSWIGVGSGLTVNGSLLETTAPTWASITGKPTTLSGYGITDAYPLSGNPSAYITQSGARSAISLTTTGSGAATYSSGTGVLNVPTPSVTPFSFGFPAAKTVAVSTSYQAADPSKAAIIYPSYACTNATQVLASSACTLQVRVHTSAVTCSTGTVYYTQSLTVNLGLLLTQNSTNPVPIFLPAGAFFIVCPTAGTFTVTAVEQTAG